MLRNMHVLKLVLLAKFSSVELQKLPSCRGPCRCLQDGDVRLLIFHDSKQLCAIIPFQH